MGYTSRTMSDAQEPNSDVEIIDWAPRYAGYFRDLNYEWLEKYFTVEPYDRIVLGDPAKQVIGRGGHIFFALIDHQVVGTCALIKQTDLKYELAKMGVTERCQGRGIGALLVRTAIKKTESLGANKLVLATSTKLARANRLYERFGFRPVDFSEIGPLPYQRTTIVMALNL
jgi:putative acetyltransferase